MRRHLDGAQGCIDMQKPFVSVIIPVLNDSRRLEACLRALADQTYPKGSYEVVVVDNGSDEDIEGLVTRFEDVVLAFEPDKGSAGARNKGISLAKGDVLAFTDADCIPYSDWIERGVECIKGVPGCGMVGGGIEFVFTNPAKPALTELYDSMIYLQQRRYVEKRRFAATANMFTRRTVIDDVGFFDNINLPFSGADNDWGWRVYLKGYKQIYCEKARVKHPARYKFGELYKKMMRTTEGKVGLGRKWLFSKRTEELNRIWRDHIVWPIDRSLYICREPRLKGRRIGLLFMGLVLLIIRILATALFLLKYKKV